MKYVWIDVPMYIDKYVVDKLFVDYFLICSVLYKFILDTFVMR